MKVLLKEENLLILASAKLEIVAVYVKPSGVETTEAMIERIATGAGMAPHRAPLVLAGDFNARLEGSRPCC